MTEKQWWDRHVHPVLHIPSLGRVAKKVQDAFQRGRPDVDYCDRGVVTLIELKYADRWPVRGGALTWSGDQLIEQRAWMREWVRAGGNALILLGVGKEYLALPHDAENPAHEELLRARAYLTGTMPDWKPLLALLHEGTRSRLARPDR
jgi:hypothetical protein